MISVRVKLFAVARDLAGISEKIVSLEDGAVASTIIDHFVEANPRFAGWKDHMRLAVNAEYVPSDYPLSEGDEVAIIPPVSGG